MNVYNNKFGGNMTHFIKSDCNFKIKYTNNNNNIMHIVKSKRS